MGMIDTNNAAKLLGVAPKTLRRWCREGKGPRHFRTAGNYLRFHPFDLESFVVQRSR